MHYLVIMRLALTVVGIRRTTLHTSEYCHGTDSTASHSQASHATTHSGTQFQSLLFGEAKEVGKGGWRKYRHNVIQCVARDLDGRIERVTHEIEQRFGGRIRAQQNTGYSVDLTPPEVNKALGISKLADYLGVRQDEVMAMGDGDNDLSMIRWAGTGVAMKNGIDEAKALSDYVAPDNDDDGVGRAIEELVLRA